MQKSEENHEDQNSRNLTPEAKAAFAEYDDIPDFTEKNQEEFKIQEPWNSAVVDSCYPPLDQVDLSAKKTCK